MCTFFALKTVRIEKHKKRGRITATNKQLAFGVYADCLSIVGADGKLPELGENRQIQIGVDTSATGYGIEESIAGGDCDRREDRGAW